MEKERQLTLAGVQVTASTPRPATRKRPLTKSEQRDKAREATLPAYVTMGHRRHSS